MILFLCSKRFPWLILHGTFAGTMTTHGSLFPSPTRDLSRSCSSRDSHRFLKMIVRFHRMSHFSTSFGRSNSLAVDNVEVKNVDSVVSGSRTLASCVLVSGHQQCCTAASMTAGDSFSFFLVVIFLACLIFARCCGLLSAITLIYGCAGFVLTLTHRCALAYPAVKFMTLTRDCLVVARSSFCVLLFSTDWRSK